MRIVTLHHPTGHPFWQQGQYRVQLPNGEFFNFQQPHLSKYFKCAGFYNNDYKVYVGDEGIYYQEYSSSSGCGRNPWGDPILIVPKSDYDKIEYAGKPLVIIAGNG